MMMKQMNHTKVSFGGALRASRKSSGADETVSRVRGEERSPHPEVTKQSLRRLMVPNLKQMTFTRMMLVASLIGLASATIRMEYQDAEGNKSSIPPSHEVMNLTRETSDGIQPYNTWIQGALEALRTTSKVTKVFGKNPKTFSFKIMLKYSVGTEEYSSALTVTAHDQCPEQKRKEYISAWMTLGRSNGIKDVSSCGASSSTHRRSAQHAESTKQGPRSRKPRTEEQIQAFRKRQREIWKGQLRTAHNEDELFKRKKEKRALFKMWKDQYGSKIKNPKGKLIDSVEWKAFLKSMDYPIDSVEWKAFLKSN